MQKHDDSWFPSCYYVWPPTIRLNFDSRFNKHRKLVLRHRMTVREFSWSKDKIPSRGELWFEKKRKLFEKSQKCSWQSKLVTWRMLHLVQKFVFLCWAAKWIFCFRVDWTSHFVNPTFQDQLPKEQVHFCSCKFTWWWMEDHIVTVWKVHRQPNFVLGKHGFACWFDVSGKQPTSGKDLRRNSVRDWRKKNGIFVRGVETFWDVCALSKVFVALVMTKWQFRIKLVVEFNVCCMLFKNLCFFVE